MAKDFMFKGKTLAELQAMSLTELSKLLPSRERRTIMRGFDHRHKKLIEKLETKDKVKTHVREMIILPQWVGKTIQVYNGKEYVPVAIEPEMIGLRLGALAMSRKLVKHNSPGVGATRSSSAISVR